jgi:hypothetical protein
VTSSRSPDLPKQRPDLRPNEFDRIEVGRVRRQKKRLGAVRLNAFADASTLVGQPHLARLRAATAPHQTFKLSTSAKSGSNAAPIAVRVSSKQLCAATSTSPTPRQSLFVWTKTADEISTSLPPIAADLCLGTLGNLRAQAR